MDAARSGGSIHIAETGTKPSPRNFGRVDVVLVRWPLEQARREQLARQGKPRLVMVEGGEAPPLPMDCLEDWIRMPADDADVDIRVECLNRRWSEHRVTRPLIDSSGVLRFGDGFVTLPPVEARLMAAMIDRFGVVVSRDQLARSGWPQGAPGRNALDVHVLRLRRRARPLGLVIKTVRSRGYLLESEERSVGAVKTRSS